MSDSGEPTPPAPLPLGGGRVAVFSRRVFPVVLWLVATMFLGGDLGRWNDDYEFNQRVPETGRFERLTEPMEGQFWRPLFFAINPALLTIFHEREWVVHTIQAVAHGLTALALVHMLGVLGVSRGARGAVAILFLACPIAFQAIFWASSLPTILSAAAFIGAIVLYARWVGRAAGGGWHAAGFVAMCVAIPLLNEQPAPALAALPLLWLRERAAGGRCSLWRAALPLALGAGACGAYLAAYLSSVPAGHPATEVTLIRAGDWSARLERFIDHMGACLALGGGWGALFRAGVLELRTAGLWGLACGAGLILSALAWVTAPAEAAPRRTGSADGAWLVLFGVASLALAWTPIVAIVSYEPASRLFYVPLIGAAVALGAAIDLAARRGRSAGARLVVRGAVAVAAVAGAIVLVGAQAGFCDQHRADASYAGQLRELVPRPRNGAFFVPVRIDDPACRVAPTWLDLNFHTILLSPINARMWIKHALGRSDVYCGPYSPDHGAYPAADPRGLGYVFRYVDRSIVEDPPGTWRVPWARVVPFEIDRLGSVRIVPRIVLERADNADAVFTVPEADAGWGRTCAFYDRGADGAVRPLAAWTWDTGGTVEFERAAAWTAVHTAARYIVSSGRGGARTPLPATPAVSTLYFRVTLPEAQVLPGPGEPVVAARVVWACDGRGARELASVELSSDSVASDQRWTPVTLVVPPHPDEDLELRVSIEPVGGMEVAAPLVTSGLWSARLP